MFIKVCFPLNIYVFGYNNTALNFDKTDIMEDLEASTINGTVFDIKKYPFNENSSLQVINFVEYCYSYKQNMRDNYGLYIYVYNPQGLNILANSNKNKIQMAVSYDEYGKPYNYEKFDLKFCSKTEDSIYKNLFYKFKIADRQINNETFFDRVNSNERRYDVSGVELLTYGNQNSTEYKVGGSYYFTGYAKGYGPDSKSETTLISRVKFLETIELDVNHTYYRTITSSKGAGYQHQLDSVYFAVPNKFFEEYGKLQRIKASWYEYKTKDIVVTSNDRFYSAALPFIGMQTGLNGQNGIPVYNENIGISLGQNAGDWGGGLNAATWGWNLGEKYLHPPCYTLYYLFKTDNIKAFNPYHYLTNNQGKQTNLLHEYIKSYNKSFDSGTIDISDNIISADLFAEDIDDYRKVNSDFGKIQMGYSYYDFDADVDLQKLTSWQEGNPSFWDNWIAWGLWKTITGSIPNETSRTISPIVTLKANEFVGTDIALSEKFLINAADITSVKSFVNLSENQDKTVVLFRFATTDYYSAAVDIIELGKGFLGSDKYTSEQAYRAYESVFLNFDVIQLSFQKDGNYMVIPAVSSPIDIINEFTPPSNFPDGSQWWKLVLGLFLLIMLVALLAPILSLLIKILFGFVSLFFKLINGIFKTIFKGKRRHK